MSYTITVSQDKKYIVLKVFGDINRKIAMQQNIEAHKLGEKRGINRYLVDVTEARNTDSVLNNYEFAYNDMKEEGGVDILARVATLVSPNDPSHNFVETVAKNSGLNVQFFTDLDDAKKYLISD